MELYQGDYFEEGIFDTDYYSIAKAICNSYQPKTVIEFGCGPGYLSRSLSKLNVGVTAIDGYSNPDFKDFPSITFTKIDLNNETEISAFISGKQFDLAICTEVAEHLQKTSSAHLIKFLTQCAPVVIFSAAVHHQLGHGHINCQPRGFWNDLFETNNFTVVDTIRKQIRDNEQLAIWYKLNIIDYVVKSTSTIDPDEIIKNLVASESFASSAYYQMSNQNNVKEAYLKYPLIKQYMELRNFAKRILKR